MPFKLLGNKRSMRGYIRAYRKSGKMFGQTFHSGIGSNYHPLPDIFCEVCGYSKHPYRACEMCAEKQS